MEYCLSGSLSIYTRLGVCMPLPCTSLCRAWAISRRCVYLHNRAWALCRGTLICVTPHLVEVFGSHSSSRSVVTPLDRLWFLGLAASCQNLAMFPREADLIFAGFGNIVGTSCGSRTTFLALIEDLAIDYSSWAGICISLYWALRPRYRIQENFTGEVDMLYPSTEANNGSLVACSQGRRHLLVPQPTQHLDLSSIEARYQDGLVCRATGDQNRSSAMRINPGCMLGKRQILDARPLHCACSIPSSVNLMWPSSTLNVGVSTVPAFEELRLVAQVCSVPV